jgi:hypothetical protein
MLIIILQVKLLGRERSILMIGAFYPSLAKENDPLTKAGKAGVILEK